MTVSDPTVGRRVGDASPAFDVNANANDSVYDDTCY